MMLIRLHLWVHSFITDKQNRDPKAMNNLLAKWAVKKSKIATSCHIIDIITYEAALRILIYLVVNLNRNNAHFANFAFF